MAMGSRAKIIIPSLFLVLVVFAFLGLSFALQRNTLVEWWKPVAICFVSSCIIGVLLSPILRRITTLEKKYTNCIVGTILSFSILFGGFYTLNFYKSKVETSQTYNALIVNKYSEERYKVKRVSRHRAAGTEKYTVYCIVIELPNGKNKKIEVSANEYVKAKNGQTLKLEIQEGFFGIPVIKNIKLPIRKYNPIFNKSNVNN